MAFVLDSSSLAAGQETTALGLWQLGHLEVYIVIFVVIRGISQLVHHLRQILRVKVHIAAY